MKLLKCLIFQLEILDESIHLYILIIFKIK